VSRQQPTKEFKNIAPVGIPLPDEKIFVHVIKRTLISVCVKYYFGLRRLVQVGPSEYSPIVLIQINPHRLCVFSQFDRFLREALFQRTPRKY